MTMRSASAFAASQSPQSKTPLQTTFEPASSCMTVSFLTASRASTSTSSGSYSTSTSSAASRASSRVARADGRDRLAHEAHLADRERVVLDLVPGRRRHLEERVGLDRDLVAGERPVDAVERERGGDVDRDDLRVRVRRADEVDVARAVPADVVEEDALALDEPLVLLARDRLADVALLAARTPVVVVSVVLTCLRR